MQEKEERRRKEWKKERWRKKKKLSIGKKLTIEETKYQDTTFRPSSVDEL